MERERPKLRRALKSRHVTMIAIGGAIGTGLFLGSGSAIRAAGPAIILAYLIVGIITFFMMRALGELIIADPNHDSFLKAIGKYLGKRAEFVTGWTYWACWLTLAMADLTATGIYLRFWFPSLPQWLGPLLIISVLLVINLVNVGLFGELESWFSLIKVLAIIILILTGFVLILLHVKVASHAVSLANLLNNGGFFPKGWWGLVKSFQMVVFAFVGVEIVGLTAGETAQPERDMPKAINTLPLRIGLFYVGSMFAIMSIYPWREVKTSSSPFVQVFAALGIVGAAGIVNFVVLTAAVSATNSCLFSTSRSLYSLAQNGSAPTRLARLSEKQVPRNALFFSTLVLLIVVLLNYLMPQSIFELISTVSTINFVFVWLMIMLAHLRFRQKQMTSEFAMPGYPLSSYGVLLFYLAILLLLFFIPATRWASVLSFIFIGSLFLLARCVLKRKKHETEVR